MTDIIMHAVEKHLRYDTSLTVREDISKHFGKERIEKLINKANKYYHENSDSLNQSYSNTPDMIIEVIRAHLINFEPTIGNFDLELYETWKDNLLVSKNKVCTFYMHVDIWLKKIDSKPHNIDELANTINAYNTYFVETNIYSLKEWLENDCKLELEAGYDSSIWNTLKFKIEDCADYNYGC